MQLKTYRANSMADALAEVKKDLGSDAVILHTRTFKSGGALGLGSKSVVEITASGPEKDQRAPGAATMAIPAPLRSPRAEVQPAQQSQTAGGGPRSTATAATKPPQNGQRTKEVFVPFIPPVLGDATAKPVSVDEPLATKVAFKPSDAAARRAIEQELASIKKLVGQVLQATRHQSAEMSKSQRASPILAQSGLPEPLFDCYLKLTESGVSADLVERIVGQVRDELSPAELQDRALVESTMVRQIAGRIPIGPPISTSASTGGPQVVALVGPTGVGKTTTIAKLAATLKLRHGRKVGLVTADTYRIAAIDQLRVYANIIGIQIKVAMTPGDIRGCVDECGDCDLVLVDTAGRSHHDTARLKELAEYLSSANATIRLMVLSAASAEPVMRRALERFGVMGPTGLVLTKLDEAVTLGAVVNVLEEAQLPLAYLTTGQEVPDQIEVASNDRLARAVLAGELSS